MKKIRLFKPSVGVEELNNIKSVFNRSWLVTISVNSQVYVIECISISCRHCRSARLVK